MISREKARVYGFLGVSSFHATTVAISSIVMFITSFFTTAPDFMRMRAYSLIFIAAAVMFIFFAFDSSRMEDAFEMCCVMVAAVAILGISIYRFWFSTWGTPTADLFVLFITTAICIPVYCVLCPLLIRQFGWSSINRVGCDAKVLRNYSWYRIFLAFLKLDFFFHAILAVLGVFFFPIDLELVAILVGLAAVLAWCLLAYWAFSREHRTAMGLFFIGWLLTPPYIIYKLWRILSDPARLPLFPIWVGVLGSTLTLIAHVGVGIIGARVCRNIIRDPEHSVWAARKLFANGPPADPKSAGYEPVASQVSTA
ncbi:hypothetical protein PAPYR_2456 [Paratrimastix pyriformis]|uniref:MFS transporter n=1 Tax=Paratrimastix pyriformis TaxID=342808 RepID=A0ABQ8UPC6_9EUKA|nr:hypothetical protein PAPYR_2456 [Paratrimastix pyriformis]